MRNDDILFMKDQDVFVQQTMIQFTPDQEDFIWQWTTAMDLKRDYCITAYTRRALSSLVPGEAEETEAPNPLVDFVQNTISTHWKSF